jgi:hypothetical protein
MPRGEVRSERLAYHDANGKRYALIRCNVWTNPCGHVQLNRELIEESDALAVQQAVADGLRRRRSAQ